MKNFVNHNELVEYLHRVYPLSGIEVTGEIVKGRMAWRATIIHPGECGNPWSETSNLVVIDFG